MEMSAAFFFSHRYGDFFFLIKLRDDERNFSGGMLPWCTPTEDLHMGRACATSPWQLTAIIACIYVSCSCCPKMPRDGAEGKRAPFLPATNRSKAHDREDGDTPGRCPSPGGTLCPASALCRAVGLSSLQAGISFLGPTPVLPLWPPAPCAGIWDWQWQ